VHLPEPIGPRPAWQADALCAEPAYADLAWFPERGQPTAPAKAVCARCLVRAECLAFAVENGITEGVWGGLVGRQLRDTDEAA
jgi:WhiB family redox-sensing transcriptional regulator